MQLRPFATFDSGSGIHLYIWLLVVISILYSCLPTFNKCPAFAYIQGYSIFKVLFIQSSISHIFCIIPLLWDCMACLFFSILISYQITSSLVTPNNHLWKIFCSLFTAPIHFCCVLTLQSSDVFSAMCNISMWYYSSVLSRLNLISATVKPAHTL